MFNMIKLEMYQIRKSKEFKILFIIAIVLSIISTVSFLSGLNDHNLALIMEENGEYLGQLQISGLDAFKDAYRDPILISILGSLIAGIYICGGFEERTINNSIIVGNSRFTIIASKLIGYFIQCMVIIPIYPIISGLIFTLQNGSDAIFSINFILYILKQFLVTGFLYFVCISISFLIAYIVRNKAVTLVLSMGVVLFMNSILSFFSDMVPFTKNILSSTPYFTLTTFVEEGAKITSHISLLLMAVATLLLFAGCAYLSFRKKDFK